MSQFILPVLVELLAHLRRRVFGHCGEHRGAK